MMFLKIAFEVALEKGTSHSYDHKTSLQFFTPVSTTMSSDMVQEL